MDSDLYVWARQREIERELTREALLSEARDLTAEDGPAEKQSGPGGLASECAASRRARYQR